MAKQKRHQYLKIVLCVGASFLIMIMAGLVYADLNINILAVNGTQDSKQKTINQPLPKELTSEDIIDTNGLKLQYDVNAKAYYVEGDVNLGPKETKTYKVKIKDVWQVNQQDVDNIKQQIDASVERAKDSEYYDRAQEKKKELLKKLDDIVKQQSELGENVEKRIDHYRLYANDLKEIQANAVSVSYWRQKSSPETDKIVKFLIEVENPSETETRKAKEEHYLPGEVKPEHILDPKGFDIRYNVDKQQVYLSKEEELKPKEKKRYEIEIKDLWYIPQQTIDNVKDRTREIYKLLENTEYKTSADYLVKNIKQNLEIVETSQAIEGKDIKQHISDYRANKQRYDIAKKDLDALEEYLQAVRENLERSILKNVLEKIRSLKSIADIAKALFKKPNMNMMWKLIIGILIFVGLVTGIHFAIWGKRSRGIKDEELKEAATEENKAKTEGTQEEKPKEEKPKEEKPKEEKKV